MKIMVRMEASPELVEKLIWEWLHADGTAAVCVEDTAEIVEITYVKEID